MKNELFNELLASVREMDNIVQGRCQSLSSRSQKSS